MMDAALIEKIGFRGAELEITTVGRLIHQDVLDRPLDGNHGEIHPKASDYVECGIPFVMATDLKNGRVDLNGCYKIPENIANGLRKGFAKTGDVLLSHKATLGRVAKVGGIAHDFIVLTPQTTYYRVLIPNVLHPDYLVQYFRSQYFQDIFKLWGGSGSTRAYLGITAQKKLPVVLPPIATQRKIAAILTAYDDLIENNRQRIALLEKMAEEIYREWFVRMRFPGHEHTPVHKGVPEGWSMGSLSALCTDIRDGVPKRRFDDAIRYVGLEHIPRRRLTLDNSEWVHSIDSNKFRFTQGDILFGKIRPYLHKVSLVDFDGICSTDAIVIRPTAKRHAEFVLLTVASDSFIDLATTASKGTKMPRADWGFLSSQQMKIPPDDLLNDFSNRTSAALDLARKLTKQNEHLAIARDLLLNRLISGKLRVDDLDIGFPPSMQQEAA